MIGNGVGVRRTLSGLRPSGTENGHRSAFIARQRKGKTLHLLKGEAHVGRLNVPLGVDDDSAGREQFWQVSEFERNRILRTSKYIKEHLRISAKFAESLRTSQNFLEQMF